MKIENQLPRNHPIRQQIRAAKTDIVLWLVVGMAIAGAMGWTIYGLRDIVPTWAGWVLGVPACYGFGKLVERLIAPQVERRTADIVALLGEVRAEIRRIGETPDETAETPRLESP